MNRFGPNIYNGYVGISAATIPTNFHTAMGITELKIRFCRIPFDIETPLYMTGPCYNLVEQACSSWLGKLGTVKILSLEIYGLNKMSIVTDDLAQKVLELDMRWGIKRARNLGKKVTQDVAFLNCKVIWRAHPGETLIWKWDTTPSAAINDVEW
jgi:hypothetical protein